MRFRRVPSWPGFFPPLQVLVIDLKLPRYVGCRLCLQVLEFRRESTTPVDAVRGEPTERAQREQPYIKARQVNERNGWKAGDRRFQLHCRRAPFCRISLPFPSVVLSRPDVSLRSIINPQAPQAPTRSFPPNRKLQTLKSRRALTLPDSCCSCASHSHTIR